MSDKILKLPSVATVSTTNTSNVSTLTLLKVHRTRHNIQFTRQDPIRIRKR